MKLHELITKICQEQVAGVIIYVCYESSHTEPSYNNTATENLYIWFVCTYTDVMNTFIVIIYSIN